MILIRGEQVIANVSLIELVVAYGKLFLHNRQAQLNQLGIYSSVKSF